jgi:hypothetical protein
MDFGFGDLDILSNLFGGFDAAGGGAASNVGSGGNWLMQLLSSIGSGGADALGGIGSLVGQNPTAALQALGSLGTAGASMYESFGGGGAGQGAPASFGQNAPPLAGPYPRRGLARADFQAQGLSGASPDFFDTMTNMQLQNPYGYSFQPGAQDERRQVYA